MCGPGLLCGVTALWLRWWRLRLLQSEFLQDDDVVEYDGEPSHRSHVGSANCYSRRSSMTEFMDTGIPCKGAR